MCLCLTLSIYLRSLVNVCLYVVVECKFVFQKLYKNKVFLIARKRLSRKLYCHSLQ